MHGAKGGKKKVLRSLNVLKQQLFESGVLPRLSRAIPGVESIMGMFLHLEQTIVAMKRHIRKLKLSYGDEVALKLHMFHLEYFFACCTCTKQYTRRLRVIFGPGAVRQRLQDMCTHDASVLRGVIKQIPSCVLHTWSKCKNNMNLLMQAYHVDTDSDMDAQGLYCTLVLNAGDFFTAQRTMSFGDMRQREVTGQKSPMSTRRSPSHRRFAKLYH